jgi:hypothetical protein
MDIPLDDNKKQIPIPKPMPKRNFNWRKQYQEDETVLLAYLATKRLPQVLTTIDNQIKLENQEHKHNDNDANTNALPQLNRVYSRGEMIDVLMAYPNSSAMLGSVVVKYNIITKHFYGVNQEFDFAQASKGEEWVILD